MEGGTTSREGKEQAFAFSVSWGRTVGDYYQTLLHCVSAWRRHCEKLVWCEGKYSCLKANSRYDGHSSSFVLLHFKASSFLPQALSHSYCITTQDKVFKSDFIQCCLLIPWTVMQPLSFFPPNAQLASVYSAPVYSRCCCGLAGIRRCMMGGSAPPGWSRSSLHSQSRTLAGYF